MPWAVLGPLHVTSLLIAYSTAYSLDWDFLLRISPFLLDLQVPTETRAQPSTEPICSPCAANASLVAAKVKTACGNSCFTHSTQGPTHSTSQGYTTSPIQQDANVTVSRKPFLIALTVIHKLQDIFTFVPVSAILCLL